MNIGAGEAILRLAVAGALSGLIGLEREAAQKNAGLRTHMLIGLGAALFTLLGAEAIPGGDPARVAAQVVTGIGFLGGGVIFRHGASVRGLTTAAGMWTVAALGMASALGEYEVALATAGIALGVLLGLRWLEWRPRDRAVVKVADLDVQLSDGRSIGAVSDAITDLIGDDGSVRLQEIGREGAALRVRIPSALATETMPRLAAIDGVTRVVRTRP
jgi:putative Mg2+ transporter-C (MgtC) family protein